MLTGYDPLTASGKCLGINTATHRIGYVEGQGGAIGIVGNMISMTFNIPVSSTAYVREVASNFGVSKNSYAAKTTSNNGFSLGYGYTGLQPVLNVWKIFRNLVYLFLVLLFIIIGLGIMFRLNVDARSVMSIQNQLPKIIVGIILVTFSYAIAGFIVDMMYVFMYLIYYIFTQQALGLDSGGLNPSYLQGQNPLGAIGGLGGASDIAFGAAKPLGHIFASLFDNSIGRIIGGVIGGIIGAGAGSVIPVIGTIAGGVIGGIAGGVVGSKLLGVVGGLIAYIIITIAIIWAMLRLWFLLLKSYIFFLVDVILAPFWIGMGLVPKAGAGFNSWLRDIIANLAVFPATLFILLLGKILVTQFGNNSSKTSFVPPLIGNPGDVSSFGPIIGLGVILLLPGVVTMVRDTLKAPGFKYTQAIGQSLSAGTGFAKQGQGLVKGALWKDDKMTGKPKGFKKLALHGLGHNAVSTILSKGAVGSLGAKIGGSKFNLVKPARNKARAFTAGKRIDNMINNPSGGLPTNDPNRGNTIQGIPAEPLDDGDIRYTINGTKVIRNVPNPQWDPKPTSEGGAQPNTTTTEGQSPVAHGPISVDVKSTIHEIAKGDEREGLSEEEINRIGEILRTELERSGHNLGSMPTLSTVAEQQARDFRENAINKVRGLTHAHPIDTAATERNESPEPTEKP